MAKTEQAIFSFTAGVLTPRISARADSPKYTSALERSENFIISPQGGAIFRQGFEYIEDGNDGRIFQFHQGGNESDIIVELLPTSTYGNGDIHFHHDGSIVPDPSPLIGAYLGTYPEGYVHSYTSSDLKDMYFTNQERFAVMCHGDHPPLYLEYLRDGSFTVTELPPSKIPTYDYADQHSPSAATGVDAEYNCIFNDVSPELWVNGQEFILAYDFVFAYDGAPEPDFLKGAYNTTSAVMVNEIMTLLAAIPALSELGTNYTVEPVGTPDATNQYKVIITGKNAGKELEILAFKSGGTSLTVTIAKTATQGAGNEPAWSFPTYVLHNGIYYKCIKPHKSVSGVGPATNEPAIGDDWALYWEDVGATKPETFDYQYLGGVNPWTENVIYVNGDRGFPTVCVFHEQRLIFAANKSATTAIWGSRIGTYDDFIKGVNAADPFSFTLDTSDTPTIKWMISQLDLIVGTSAGDWAIGAEVSLGPSDISAQKQNYARSHHTHPVAINTNVFYIEQGLTKMRMTQYQRQKLGFVSDDISIIAEHLLHAGIKRIVILRTPEVMLVALRNDGALIALTYGEDIGAWYELKSQGFVQDISAYYSTVTNQDELYLTIAYAYDPQGPNQFYLERMAYPSRTMTPKLTATDDSLTEQGVVCMDSWIVGVASDNVIIGLEHLNGHEVGALVDDAWTGTYTVEDGQITLDDLNISGSEPWNGVSAVGLLYTGDLKTFEIATGNRSGTGLGTTRRWSKLVIRLLNSALPKVNGTLPPDRTPESQMDIAEILRMGLQDVVLRGAGWGDGAIEIIQDRPYPTQVVGLFGDFQLGSD